LANRASGELGLIAFLQGDSRHAAVLVRAALLGAMRREDIGGQIARAEARPRGPNSDFAWGIFPPGRRIPGTSEQGGHRFGILPHGRVMPCRTLLMLIVTKVTWARQYLASVGGWLRYRPSSIVPPHCWQSPVPVIGCLHLIAVLPLSGRSTQMADTCRSHSA
jgi:hypothetical protein